MAERIRVVIADDVDRGVDQPVFLKGLRLLLELADPAIDIVGTASTGREVLKLIANDGRVDVALLDIQMPDVDGIEAARTIKRAHRPTKAIILTTFDDRKLISASIAAGVDGFLLKDADENEIVSTIRQVHEGYVIISKAAAQVLAAKPENGEAEASAREGRLVVNSLPPRHQEVFFLLVHGRDNSQISDELHLSEKTVRNYVSHIYEALDVHNRSAVLIWAQAHGLI